MPKNIGTIKLKGNMGELNFCNNGIVRMRRGSIDKKVLNTKPSLQGIRETNDEFKGPAKSTKLLKDILRNWLRHTKHGDLHNRICSVLNKIKNNDTAVRGSSTISGGLKTPMGRHLLRTFEFTPTHTVLGTLGGKAIYDSEKHIYTVSDFNVSNVVFPQHATHLEISLALLRIDFENLKRDIVFGPPLFIDKNFQETNFTVAADEPSAEDGTLIALAAARFHIEIEGDKHIVEDFLGIDILDCC